MGCKASGTCSKTVCKAPPGCVRHAQIQHILFLRTNVYFSTPATGLYGRCWSYRCKNYPLVPIGLSPEYGKHKVKMYCNCCGNIFKAKPLYHKEDGAFWGSTCSALLFLDTPKKMPKIEPYVPKIYGFRVHQTSKPGDAPGDDSIKPLPTDSEEVRELKNKVKALVNEKRRWQKIATNIPGILQGEDVVPLPPKRKRRRKQQLSNESKAKSSDNGLCR